MATVTPRRDLHESQRRVRHPLERVRGTIRMYVGLEAAALLVTLVAFWFWLDLAFDYGFFAALGFDWVQEVPRSYARAFLIGLVFLGAAFGVNARYVAAVTEQEVRTIVRTAFASGGGRHTLPVWLRLPLVAIASAGFAYLGSLVSEWTAAIAGGVAGATVSVLHEIFVVRGRSSIAVWMRALHAGGGALIGGVLGYLAGASSGEVTIAVVVASLLATIGDAIGLLFMSVNVLLYRRKCYVVPLALPVLAAFLVVWGFVGFLADKIGSAGSALLVAVLIAGPVLFLSLKRLLHDFRDDALALVLEKRFPAVLGDRLITAVELTDPKEAARLGYSEAMLLATVHDAAERVDTVPVSETFDWKRLSKKWGIAFVLTFLLYAVAGLVFAAPGLYRREAGAVAGFSQLNEVSSLWMERNVFLRNTIWPRRAFLEVLDWPEGDELKVGRDQAAPALRLRALKWVVADAAAKEGWRALTWNDLVTRRDLLGTSVADNVVPAAWGNPRDAHTGWTLDEIETRLEKADTRAALDGDALSQMEDVFATLRSRAADPTMRRTLRSLVIPQTVTVSYRGNNTSGQMPLDRRGDNEYAGSFGDLKESIRFTVKGEDYYTRTLKITVVPTPSLMELVADEYLPAYMFYRVTGDKPELLKGKKQLRKGRQISLYGGDTSRLDAVAAGSDIVLTAKADKELVSARIAPPRKGVAEVRGEVELVDARTFRVRFDNVRATAERPSYDFYFEFKDADGVTGLRHIVLKPVEDRVPSVDVAVEVVRKSPQGYMVTPSVRIPLRIKVEDDYGLDSLEFAATYSKIDKGAEGGVRGLLAISALHLMPGGPGLELSVASRLAAATRDAKEASARAEADVGVKKFPVAPFARHIKESAEVRREYWTPEAIDKQLKDAPPGFSLTRQYDLVSVDHDAARESEWYFSLAPLRLKADEAREIQPRYRLQLWVEARDNDIETGPHVGTSKEKHPLAFLIVSENELLSEVAKEEEGLYTKLVERVNHLGEANAKLDRVKGDLTAEMITKPQFDGMALRALDVQQTAERAENIVTEIHTDYRRILQELVVNDVQKGMIERVERQICDPLQEALEKDFPAVRKAVEELHRTLGDENNAAGRMAASRKGVDDAREKLGELIRKLTGVLDQMKQLADLNEAIKKLREIEQGEVASSDVLKALKLQMEGDILEILRGGKPKN